MKIVIDVNKESDHQKVLFKWASQPSILQRFPDLDLMFHIKNETIGDYKQIAFDKSQGVKKGVPDILLPVPRGRYAGLFIELKTPKGRPSKEQIKWINNLNNAGYKAVVAYGWDKARDEIVSYMQGQ